MDQSSDRQVSAIRQLQAEIASLRCVIERMNSGKEHLNAIIQHLGTIIGKSNIGTRSCESCGWIDYGDNIQECHPGSGFPICESCVCTCTEDESDDEYSDESCDELAPKTSST